MGETPRRKKLPGFMCTKLSAPRAAKTKQPGVGVSFAPRRKPDTPEVSFISAAFEQEKKAGVLITENNGIPMFPNIPEAQQDEGGRRLARNSSRNAVGMELADVGIRREAEADGRPETCSNATTKENVVGRLFRSVADGAVGLGSGQNLLPKESAARLNPGLGEQPGEELNLGRGTVLPDKVVGGRGDAPPSPELIERRGIQLPGLLLASREHTHISSPVASPIVSSVNPGCQSNCIK